MRNRADIPHNRQEYTESALLYRLPAIYGGLIKAENALCEDGKRRNAYPSHKGGHADTFFSVPAYVYVGRTRVYGYVTTDYYDRESPDDMRETVKFHAYTYMKNHGLLTKVVS